MDRILRQQQVCALVGLRPNSIYRLEQRGDCPRRIRLIGRAVGWHEAEVQEWLASRARATSRPLSKQENQSPGDAGATKSEL